MSTSTTNSNYAPPPPNGQFNMMNGMPPTTISQLPPQLQQQKQAQFSGEQQPTLQAASTVPGAMFNNNVMSKFMPPPLNATPLATSTPNTTMAANNLSNGAVSNIKPLSTASTPATQQLPANNNLPAHLRPPTMPYSAPTSASTTLTNGSNGIASAQSSRTASPALLQTSQPPTSLQQQQLHATSNPLLSNANSGSLQSLSSSMQNLNLQRPSGPVTAAAVAPTGMPPNFTKPQPQQPWQNVNMPAKPGIATTALPQSNFKTSALNTPDVIPTSQSNTTATSRMPMPTQTTNMFGQIPNAQPLRPPQPVPTSFASSTAQPTMPPPPTAATSVSGNMPALIQPTNQPATIAATTTNAYMPTQPGTVTTPGYASNAKSQAPTGSTAFMPPTSSTPFMPPTSSTSFMPPTSSSTFMPPASSGNFMPPTSRSAYTPPNMIGNAMQQMPTPLQQQQFSPQPQQQVPLPPPQQQAPPPVGITQQKRLYPQQTQMPPMPAAAAPQQQTPYAQVYQQDQLQQQQQQQQQLYTAQPRGMFNGQASSGPLQYQNQMPMQQQQYQQGVANQGQQQQQQQQQLAPNVLQHGFNRLWGQDTIDLMQNRHILSPATIASPKVVLHNQFHESINCNPSIMRCTMAKIPESNSLLQKSRLPLGILIHPFRDINSLPVIQCPNIVRCRLCRTYINPFVYFVDSKMWKCNLCYRVNELPDDFQFDPATKTYGDVTRRPEVRSSTIEFIAPSEYMLRPPQPAIYLFLFDVSILAQQCGYLENACALLSKHLDDMPGDARTQVGFIAYNSNVHFYSMADGYNQPHEMTLLDIDDVFLPRPDNLLVNLKECKELVKDLLNQLPKRFAETHDSGSALGAALQVAYKLMQASGGRVTVFQTCLPNKGPGSLEPREDPNNRSAKDVAHLNPATDFYKRYALECSGYQIAVDLFLLNQQYSDMATISGISKHSGGCVHHFPLYQKTKSHHVDALKNCLKRYLTRKIGFEAVMRIRCTRGLQVHTFHGNFFVRSTDLLSLPNVNPDAGFGMQISYEESLTDVKTICFQAALLYTNSEGERRIRVHTLCLPVTASLPEVMHSADTEAIIGLLAKMAVDRSVTSNIADAREAFINATVDILNAFKIAQNLPSGQTGQLIAPRSLALMPLYILALLKHPAFRVGTSTRLDDRVFAMDCMKTLPLDQLMKYIYPEFYNIDVLFYNAQNSNAATVNNDEEDEEDLPDVPRLQLSAEYLDSRSIFLLDCGALIMLYVGLNVPTKVLESVLGITSTAELPDYCYALPNVNSNENDALKRFIMRINDEKPYQPIVQIIRDTSTAKPQFIEKLVDDRSESSLSYYEFLQHIRTQVK